MTTSKHDGCYLYQNHFMFATLFVLGAEKLRQENGRRMVSKKIWYAKLNLIETYNKAGLT